MKFSRNALGNLINRYKAVLKKCNLINVFGSLAIATALTVAPNASLAGTGVTDNVTITKNDAPLSTSDTTYMVNNGETYTFTRLDGTSRGSLRNYSSTGSGGAISNGGIVTIQDVDFSGNSVTGSNGYGGAVFNHSSATMTFNGDAVFSNNSADKRSGGAVYNHSSATMTFNGDATFSNNTAGNFGGAIHFQQGNLSFDKENGSVKFEKNSAAKLGGALHNYSSTADFTGTGSEITFNQNEVTNGNGGVVSNFADGANIATTSFGDGVTVTFSENKATLTKATSSYLGTAVAYGGAIFNFLQNGTTGNATLNFGKAVVNFTGNEVTSAVDNAKTGGGALYNNSIVNFTGTTVTFSDNKATATGTGGESYGGAVYNDTSATMTFGGTTVFSNNSAGGSGGAVYNSGTLNLATAVFGATYNESTQKYELAQNFQGWDGSTGTANDIYNDGGTVKIGYTPTEEGATPVTGNVSLYSGYADNNSAKLNISADSTLRLYGGEGDLSSVYSFANTDLTVDGTMSFLAYDEAASTTSQYTLTNAVSGTGTLEVGKNAQLTVTPTEGVTFSTALKVDGTVFFQDEYQYTLTNAVSGTGTLEVVGQDTMLHIASANLTAPESTAEGAASVVNKGRLVFDGGSETTPNVSALALGITQDGGRTEVAKYAEVTVNGGTFKNNASEGAIFNSGIMTFDAGSDVTFTDNTTSDSGGAVCNNSTMTFNGDATFSGNSAGKNGGAVYNGGTLNLATAVFGATYNESTQKYELAQNFQGWDGSTGTANDIYNDGGTVKIGYTPTEEGATPVTGNVSLYSGYADNNSAKLNISADSTLRLYGGEGDLSSVYSFANTDLTVDGTMSFLAYDEAASTTSQYTLTNAVSGTGTLEVGKNAQLTVTSATLTAPESPAEGAASVVNKGTLIFEAGTEPSPNVSTLALGITQDGGRTTVNQYAEVTVNGGTFSNGDYSVNGGAVCNYGTMTFTGDAVFSGNTAVTGNDMYNDGNVVIADGANVVLGTYDSGDAYVASANGTLTFTGNGTLTADFSNFLTYDATKPVESQFAKTGVAGNVSEAYEAGTTNYGVLNLRSAGIFADDTYTTSQLVQAKNVFAVVNTSLAFQDAKLQLEEGQNIVVAASQTATGGPVEITAQASVVTNSGAIITTVYDAGDTPIKITDGSDIDPLTTSDITANGSRFKAPALQIQGLPSGSDTATITLKGNADLTFTGASLVVDAEGKAIASDVVMKGINQSDQNVLTIAGSETTTKINEIKDDANSVGKNVINVSDGASLEVTNIQKKSISSDAYLGVIVAGSLEVTNEAKVSGLDATGKVTAKKMSVGAMGLSEGARADVEDLVLEGGTAEDPALVTVGSDDAEKGGDVLTVGNLTLSDNAYLITDPAWDLESSKVAVADLAGSSEARRVMNTGGMAVCQNAMLAVGTADTAWLTDAVGEATSGAGLTKDGVTAAFGLNARLSITGGGKILADGASNETIAADFLTKADPGSATFAAGSLLVVNGDITGSTASEAALQATAVKVEDGAKLYVTNVKNARNYYVVNTTDGLTFGDEQNGWSDSEFLKIDNKAYRLSFHKDGVSAWVTADLNDLGGLMPKLDRNLADAANILVANDGSLDSANYAARLVNRAVNRLSADAAAATIEGAAKLAFVAGVPQVALDMAKAAHTAVASRDFHASTPGTGVNASDDSTGLSVWAMPTYQHKQTHGFSSGSFKHGSKADLGGMALGADYTVNRFRYGLAINGGGGKNVSYGDFDKTWNDVNFFGANLYGAYEHGDFSLFADLGYLQTSNTVKQNMPSVLGMGRNEADVTGRTYGAGIRGSWNIKTDVMDITPHVGVQYYHVRTDHFGVENGGRTVINGDRINANIVQFPIGVTLRKDLVDNGGWNVKGALDLSVVPACGDKRADQTVRLNGADVYGAGIDHAITDRFTGRATVGIEATKGKWGFGLNYGFEAGSHTRDQGVQATVSWKF